MLEGHLDMTLRRWIERYQHTIMRAGLHYRGVTILKNVLDLWVYQEIIHETAPDLVIETGTRHGGSALWLSDVLAATGGGRVITIDIEPVEVSWPDNVTFIHGNSVDPDVMERVADEASGARAMVIADSDHSAAHVRRELELYAPLVADGCYYIVEDGIVDVMQWERFTPGPLPAVRDFLSSHPEFEADAEREKFILTYNPGCFLRRIGG